MSNNNTADSVKCPVCLTPFDADKHIPKISPACGHTVCKECLIQVLEMDTPKCPLDKLKFSRDFRTIDTFPTNFLGKDLLEMEGKWGICESHQEQQKMICLTDHTLVCGNCVVFGEHKGHNIKKLSTFEEAINQKKNELSVIGERVSKISSEFTDALDEKKENIQNTIQDRFQTLRSEITKQEIAVLMEVENMFKDEKTKLSSMISASLEMPFDIQAKMKELYNGMSNPNIVKLVEEDFSGLEKILEEKLAPFKTKHTEEISELLAVFQNNLPKEDLLKDFNVIEPLNKGLAKLIAKRNIEETKEITLLPVKFEIKQESENESWTLKIKDSKSMKPWTFSKADLERISKVQYTFKLTKNMINEADLSSIKLYSKSLKNVKTVHINIKADSVFESLNEARFFHLISAIFSQLDENIQEIGIDINNAPIRDFGLVNLAETVLPRLKNLKVFSCTLDKTHTTSKALKALSKVDFSKCSDLQKFHVDIKRCPLNEDGVVEFLNRVPNVKDVLLGFGAANSLTDKAFDSFSTNILPSLNNVESLEVRLLETKITDEGVQKFLNHIPNVKTLGLDFSKTQITDAAIKDFLTSKLETLTNLKDLNLILQETQVSKDILGQISEWGKKLNPEKKQKNNNQEEDENEEEDEEEEEEGNRFQFEYVDEDDE